MTQQPMDVNVEQIFTELQAWFSAGEHKDRKLRGGGDWLYVPHQTIRDRLNKVAKHHWELNYSPPQQVGEDLIVYCYLTICGVTRTGIGSNKAVPEVNDRGNSKEIGTPIERACRAAFKDACEMFNIASYLDEQSGDRRRFIQHMNEQGDRRAYRYSQGDPQPTTNAPSLKGTQGDLKSQIEAEFVRLGIGSEAKEMRAEAYSIALQKPISEISPSRCSNLDLSKVLAYLKSQDA